MHYVYKLGLGKANYMEIVAIVSFSISLYTTAFKRVNLLAVILVVRTAIDDQGRVFRSLESYPIYKALWLILQILLFDVSLALRTLSIAFWSS